MQEYSFYDRQVETETGSSVSQLEIDSLFKSLSVPLQRLEAKTGTSQSKCRVSTGSRANLNEDGNTACDGSQPCKPWRCQRFGCSRDDCRYARRNRALPATRSDAGGQGPEKGEDGSLPAWNGHGSERGRAQDSEATESWVGPEIQSEASWGALSLPRKSSENLEKVPRIWEGEGSRRSEILNPINNDYWVPLRSSLSTRFFSILSST